MVGIKTVTTMKQYWVYSACLLMIFVSLSLVPVTNSWPSHCVVRTLGVVSGSLSSQALSEWYWSLKLFWTIHQHLLSMRPCEDVVVVQLASHIWLFATPWTAACQAFLSLTIFLSLPKFMSIELMMPSNHLILCCPLVLLPSIFPSIRVFSNESTLHIRWPK